LGEFVSDEDSTAELASVVTDEPEMLAHVAQQLRGRRDRVAVLVELRAGLCAADSVWWCRRNSPETSVGYRGQLVLPARTAGA
jgi:hypothetical protein